MFTCPAPECTPVIHPEERKVWVFVDGSNVWIAAKELAKERKDFDTSQDWRVRISWKQLVEAVVSERQHEVPNVYVSKRPEDASVWSKLRNVNMIEKIVSDSGKEKEVDCQITADIVELACNTPEVDRSTIILIGGDRDFKPAVEMALKKGWRVEIYMWKQAFSNYLKEMETKSEYSGRCYCKYLDEFDGNDENRKKLTFTRVWLDENRENWPGGSTVYLQTKERASDIIDESTAQVQGLTSKEWWSEIEKISKWPVQGQWNKESMNQFVLLFETWRDGQNLRNFDVQRFQHNLMEKLKNNEIPVLTKTIVTVR